MPEEPEGQQTPGSGSDGDADMEDDKDAAGEEQHQRMLEEIRAAGRPASSKWPKQVQTESVPESALNVGPMTDLPGMLTFIKCRVFLPHLQQGLDSTMPVSLFCIYYITGIPYILCLLASTTRIVAQIHEHFTRKVHTIEGRSGLDVRVAMAVQGAGRGSCRYQICWARWAGARAGAG